MSATPSQSDSLLFVEPSPIARRLLWHLFSLGTRRVEREDRHERFEKPGAHLFWVQSGEGELEYKSRRFKLRRGKEIWLVDMAKPRTYLPAPGRHLNIVGFRFGGPGLEFWHEEFRDEENAEFTLEDFKVVTRIQSELLRLVRNSNVEYDNMLERLLTQETSFLRYPGLFSAFERHVLPAQWRAGIDDAVEVHHAQKAPIARLEGLNT